MLAAAEDHRHDGGHCGYPFAAVGKTLAMVTSTVGKIMAVAGEILDAMGKT